MPYLGSVSLQARTRLRKLFSKTMPFCDLRVVFKSPFKPFNFFRFKDRVPNYLTSGVIYQCKCGSCNATYIGKSIRHCKVRYCEHLNVSHLTGKRLLKYTHSAVGDHILQHQHDIVLDDFSIIAKEKINYILEIKESLVILRDKPSLNKTIYTTPLYLYNS